jgi:hypothetical protein
MALDSTLKQEDALRIAETERNNRAQEANTRRGQDLVNARSAEANEINKQAARTQAIQTPDGGVMLVDKGTGLARSAVGLDGRPVRQPSAESLQRQRESTEVLGLLDQAEPIITQATGSRIGSLADQAAGAFGGSTPGAQAAAQLKVLEGRLIGLMPKMSGPQSDKDVQLYRDMAGQLGDPTVPAPQKQAALQTLRQLHQKYAQGSQGGPARVANDADYDRLPSGTPFVGPDGVLRRKP